MTAPENLTELLDLELDLEAVSMLAQRNYLQALAAEQKTDRYGDLIAHLQEKIRALVAHKQERNNLASAVDDALSGVESPDCPTDDLESE